MIWIWVLGPFAALVLLLLVKPVWLRLEWRPFVLHVSWMGLGVELGDQPTQILCWGFRWQLAPADQQPPRPAKPKAEKSKTEKPRKPGKTSFQQPSLDLARKLWGLGLLQRVALRLKTFILGLVKAVRLHYLGLQLGQLEVFETGVLGAVFASLPLDERFDLQTNFLGEQQARLVVSLSLGRILWEFLKLMILFPYLKAWRAYKCVQVKP